MVIIAVILGENERAIWGTLNIGSLPNIFLEALELKVKCTLQDPFVYLKDRNKNPTWFYCVFIQETLGK